MFHGLIILGTHLNGSGSCVGPMLYGAPKHRLSSPVFEVFIGGLTPISYIIKNILSFNFWNGNIR